MTATAAPNRDALTFDQGTWSRLSFVSHRVRTGGKPSPRPVLLRLGLRTLVALAAPVAFAACSAGESRTVVPASAKTTVFSLQEIECQRCGAFVVQALQDERGVYEVSFDLSTAEVTVIYDSALATSHEFVTLARTLGYNAEDGSGRGGDTPSVAFPDGLDVIYISQRGEMISLED